MLLRLAVPLWLGSALLAVACSGDGLDDAGTAALDLDDTAQGWANITVQRSRPASSRLEGATSQAMASFVSQAEDPAEVMAISGLGQPLPPIGTCGVQSDPRVDAQRDLGSLELLGAGTVSLTPEGSTRPIALAPRAFPSVSSFAAGIVYTSRDRDGDALPSNARYNVLVTGSDEFPRLELDAQAPAELSEVTLGGEPFESALEHVATQPLDLTWTVGAAGDIVYADVTVPGKRPLRCAFDDADGSGSIAAEALSTLAETETTSAELVLHRRRQVQARGDGGAELVVLFDFELDHLMQLTR